MLYEKLEEGKVWEIRKFKEISILGFAFFFLPVEFKL
jgi:hypothetical protein